MVRPSPLEPVCQACLQDIRLGGVERGQCPVLQRQAGDVAASARDVLALDTTDARDGAHLGSEEDLLRHRPDQQETLVGQQETAGTPDVPDTLVSWYDPYSSSLDLLTWPQGQLPPLRLAVLDGARCESQSSIMPYCSIVSIAAIAA